MFVWGLLSDIQVDKGAFRGAETIVRISLGDQSEEIGLSTYRENVNQIGGETSKPVDTKAIELMKGAVDSSTGNSRGLN